jgi:hypothetical protein
MQTAPTLDEAISRFVDAVADYVTLEATGDEFTAAEALGAADHAIDDAVHAHRS